MTVKKGIERHHLFPRRYLREVLGVTDTRQVNQIANMALVEWSDNVKISDQAPAVYWPGQLADKIQHAGYTRQRLAGQVYWHALPDGWEHLDYPAFLAARRTLMAKVVRDAFACLSDRDYRPSYPASEPPAVPDAKATWTYYGVKVKDLLDAGLLEPGNRLTAKIDGMEAVATVLGDGRIAFGDSICDTPSRAGYAAKGAGVNGWAAVLLQAPLTDPLPTRSIRGRSAFR